MTARQQAIAAIASHKVASTQNYLEHAGEDIYGEYVFGEEAQRQYLPKPVFQEAARAPSRASSPSIRRSRTSWRMASRNGPWPTAPPTTRTGSCP